MKTKFKDGDLVMYNGVKLKGEGEEVTKYDTMLFEVNTLHYVEKGEVCVTANMTKRVSLIFYEKQLVKIGEL